MIYSAMTSHHLKTHRLNGRPTARILVSLTLAAGALTGVLATSSHAATTTNLVDVMNTITMPDGVVLAAETVTAAGSGPHPLVVMPGSWGSNQLQYHSIALLFGNAGYDVIGYSPRGMGTSQGVADYADPTTVSDVSSVINWAVAHLAADPNHVGVFGISYGAGVGLLAAEKDSRIKAVAALSTWTDFAATFLPSGSISNDLIRALAQSTTGTSPHVRLGSDTSTLFSEYLTDPTAARALIRKLAPSRSPITGVSALNTNHTAVMLANGMQDSLLPPLQLVSTYKQLTGPKKLELRTGDHGQPEAAALFGGSPVGPVADSLAWMDRYVRGIANGIDKAKPVTLTDTITGVTTGYSAWPGTTAPDALAAPATIYSDPAAVAIGDPTEDAWTRAVPWGLNTYAETGYEQTDFTDPYRIQMVSTSKFTAYFSYIWNGPTTSTAQGYAGSPTLTLSVTATQPTVTMVAYLFDVDASGTASFTTVAPATLTGLSTATSQSVTLNFQPIDWTVAAGHHLALVVDSGDHRWGSSNVPNTALQFTSTAATPAQLVLPTK